MTNKERAQKIQNVLEAANVNVRKVLVLGAYVHIDSFDKYAARIKDIMTTAGFKFHSENGGQHLDGTVGMRSVFVI